eukprot:m.160198 g.160198  ORF g.160198 m.160198 type:complete len:82 (-) comp16356_c0_seq7:129-374(-)
MSSSSKYVRVKEALWEDEVINLEQIFQFFESGLTKAISKGSPESTDLSAVQAMCAALEDAHQMQRRPTTRPGSKYNPIAPP